VKKLKKVKTPKMPKAMGMESFKPKPVSIHIHAEGAHMKEAHDDLAKQLKPMGFTQKKMRKGGKGKSIATALSS
jgi:hypothetical protein